MSASTRGIGSTHRGVGGTRGEQGRRRHPRRRPLPSPGGVSISPARGEWGRHHAGRRAARAACVSAEARRRAVRTRATAGTRRSAGSHPRRRPARPSPAPTQKRYVRGRRARGGRGTPPNFRGRGGGERGGRRGRRGRRRASRRAAGGRYQRYRQSSASARFGDAANMSGILDGRGGPRHARGVLYPRSTMKYHDAASTLMTSPHLARAEKTAVGGVSGLTSCSCALS